GATVTLMAAPILDQGAEVGVVEVINKLDGTAFEEDDLFALTTMCATAAGALQNASLLQAERKVEILETLVKVSQEITSTLNLDRVLQAVVNGPQAVIPYERAAIALEQRGRTQLKAVSGVEQIMSGDADIKRLREPLLKQKTRFLSMEKGRRISSMALAGLVLLFLAIFPLPMRLDGEAAVSPLGRAQIQPQIEGVIKKVYVHEGDAVQAGAVLADLDDWDDRAALEKAQASYGAAL